MNQKYKFLIALLIGSSINIYANATQIKTLHYDFISEGKDIGDVTQRYIIDGDKLVLTTNSRLKWSAWYASVDLEELSIEVYSNKTKLEKSSYYLMDYDEGSLYLSSFKKINDNYLINVFLNENIKKNINAFKQFSKQITNSKDVRKLNKATLSTDMNEIANKKISAKSFDTTENMLYLNLKYKLHTKIIQSLSLSEVSIDSINIKDLGMQELSINNKKFICHHIKIISKEKEPSEIWITDEKSNLPYVVRLIGKDDTGKYELLLK